MNFSVLKLSREEALEIHQGRQKASGITHYDIADVKAIRNNLQVSPRFFRVEIHPEYREEFEAKFRSFSVGALEAQEGCVSIEIGFAVESNPNEYTMISKWQSKDKLIALLGEDWHRAFIPEGMEKYAKQCSVQHYKLAYPVN